MASQSLTICSNSSVVMPACVAMTISSIDRSPPASTRCTSFWRSDANGSFSFHSGCWGASACTRSSAKNSWKYIGCSAQSVPSLSKTAMRSAGGTKSGEPFFVTFATNSTILAFAGPSFHDGSGSDRACARLTTYHGAHTTAASTHLLILCPIMFAEGTRCMRRGGDGSNGKPSRSWVTCFSSRRLSKNSSFFAVSPC